MKKRIITVVAVFFIFLGAVTLFAAPNTWTQKANFLGTAREDAVGFSIGGKGYIGTGEDYQWNLYNDFWEYDPAGNTWTQKASLPGAPRTDAVGFSIGGKGYIGTGEDVGELMLSDFWEYNPITNAWTQKADFPGTPRSYATGFAIANNGYIGTGWDGDITDLNDFWEYNPITNAWTQKADFPGAPRDDAVGFSLRGKGYIGIGWTYYGLLNDFWEYNPVTNAWTHKADFPMLRDDAAGFSIAGKGYIGTGEDDNYNYKDFWEYDPNVNTWIQKADFGGIERDGALGFSIGGRGYIGTGWGGSAERNDFWEYEAASPFSDVASTYWAYDHIVTILNRGYTTGTTATTYSPESPVTREQMAAFIVRAAEGEPPANYCSAGSPFPDCATDSWSCGYIKRLYELGLTTGYGTTGLFMPALEVTRAQMAAFIVRAVEGEPAANYCASGSPFTDVIAADWSCIYIKRLYELGITTGYGNGLYGPNDLVTRAQMAVFLGRAFWGWTRPQVIMGIFGRGFTDPRLFLYKNQLSHRARLQMNGRKEKCCDKFVIKQIGRDGNIKNRQESLEAQISFEFKALWKTRPNIKSL